MPHPVQTGGPRVGAHALEYLPLWYCYCWVRVNNWCVRVRDVQCILLSYWEPQLLRTVAGFLCGKAAVFGEPIKGRPRVSRCKHFAPRPGCQPVGNTEPSYSAVICYEGNGEACFFFIRPLRSDSSIMTLMSVSAHFNIREVETLFSLLCECLIYIESCSRPRLN